MHSRVSVRQFPGVLGALFALVAAVPAAAQTHDEARLTVGVAGGYIGGSTLWSVDHQPIINLDGNQSLLNLHRRLGSNLTISAQGAYYISPHLGYTAEFTYVGLGTEDNCDFVSGNNSLPGQDACAALNGSNRPASAVSLMGGVVWRPFSRTAYQPYIRGLIGAAVVPRSTLQLASTFGVELENRLEIYTEENSRMVRPSSTVGFGISTAANAGYQLTIEGRGTAAVIPVVTGPTLYQGLKPPSSNRLKVFPSILVGLNIVLERRRGRRY
jgi:hypothetical protein